MTLGFDRATEYSNASDDGRRTGRVKSRVDVEVWAQICLTPPAAASALFRRLVVLRRH